MRTKSFSISQIFSLKKSESLEVSLAEAKQKICELTEFLEKSKARETKLAQMLTRTRSGM